MKKIISLLAILLVTSLMLSVFTAQTYSTLSQPPTLQWDRTYGGTAYDHAFSVIQTSEGGYAIAGETDSFGTNRDALLVKTDAAGTLQWNKTYGGGGVDTVYSLIQTLDGGYAMVGFTQSYGAGDNNYWLVKTDARGNMQWNKTYGGMGHDSPRCLVQTNDGGYAFVGYTYSFGAGSDDFWLVKTDKNGTLEWNQTYGGGSDDFAYSMVQTVDGGYALAGVTRSFGAGQGDFWLVKTDGLGNEQWNKTYGGTQEDWPLCITKTRNGGYAIAGCTLSFGAGGSDMWLVKVDSSGNTIWNQTYGGQNDEEAWSVVEKSDGGYAIAGQTKSFGAGNSDFWLVLADAQGHMEWNGTYGGSGLDVACSIVQTNDGGYTLAGGTESFGAGARDFWLVKLGRAISWEHIFKDPCTGTILKISTDDKYFQFIAPSKDFGIKYDYNMRVCGNIITICYKDQEFSITAIALNCYYCVAFAKDLKTGKTYLLVDLQCMRVVRYNI